MTARTHRFKVGQTVNLIPSIFPDRATLKSLACDRLKAKRHSI